MPAFSFVVGYGIGKLLHFIWWALEFRDIDGKLKSLLIWAALVALSVLTLVTFNRDGVWQNSIRSKMDMPLIDGTYPWLVAGVAILTALVLIALLRAVIWLAWRIGATLNRVLPRRTANTLGVLIAFFVVFTLFNDFVVQKALRAADNIFAAIDRADDDDVSPPTHGFASGGANSIVEWDDIGTNGKAFLTGGPSQADITDLTGRPAREPVRIYAGYGSGEDFDARAQIALRDLIALGGFDRSVLIVATPTGTGWLDPAAIEPVTYLHNGDLAIVSMQYAYVPSWLSIIVEPDRSRIAARALFDTIFEYWTDLPKDNRPELYLFGLSLGALGSEASADLVTMLDDPIQGALWSGPPFASTTWASLTARRNEGSSAWLPEFRDGGFVRFMNQNGMASPPGAKWGNTRFVYLQYASDPMVFFSSNLALSRPDWLVGYRVPDLSEYFNWYPLVTFLQVAFDVPMATSTPSGHGHTYDALDYIDGWIEVTRPAFWSDADTMKLKALYTGFEASPI